MSPIITLIVRWFARGAAILIAAVFLAFVLGQPAGPLPAILSREWVGMVLLFGAVVAMLLALKWEFPAALVSLLALAAFGAVIHMRRYDVLAIPAIPNILFLLDWKLRHFQSPPTSTAGGRY